MENKQLTKYERAQQRIAQLKGFYNHLSTYVIINAVLLIFQNRITFVLVSKEALGNPKFLDWIDWNVYGTLIIWGIVLAIHGIKVFGNISFFGKDWENRKIQELMEEEERNEN